MKKIGYKIIGKKCGRDKKGEFHCHCGKCRPLTQICQNCKDSSKNGSNGGNN